MPVQCPLCDDSHTIDDNGTPVRCGLCNGGDRRFIDVQDVSLNSDARGWLAYTAHGGVFLAFSVNIGGGYCFMGAQQLPVERMVTAAGRRQVFDDLRGRCHAMLNNFARQQEHAAGQSVH